ncbi:MAG: DUF262 domain-containing protein [Bacillota bacterium]
MTNNRGVEMTFLELLEKYPVVIPIIQRDYAQGREDEYGQSKYQEVRDGIIEALYRAVVAGESITLDYIYGSVDSAGRFLPIDGQQRLTTLFLLHWYLANQSNKIEEVKDILSKFSYEVRDSALEFCMALTENSVSISNCLSESIKNAAWFYRVYKNDPTVRAILIMLDAIHSKFKDEDPLNCFERLTNDKIISFWVLTLEGFGLTDDLFIKMNARGKSLTRFETFKSEFESVLDNTEQKDLRETWKDKIDNEWLDFFWLLCSHETAEDCMFRFLLFIMKALSSKNGRFITYSGLLYVNYRDDLITVCLKDNLEFIVDVIERLDYFLQEECFFNLHEIFERLILDTSKTRDVTFSERARIYAAFRYLYVFEGNINDYQDFERVINNLVLGQRRLQTNRKQYESSLDAQNFGSFIEEIDALIDRAHECGGTLNALAKEEISLSGLNYLQQEVNKAKYLISNGSLNPDKYKRIIEIEKIPKLRGMIHNIFFDNDLNLTKDQLEKILTVKPRLLLQCIQAYSEDILLERKFYGDGKYLASGKVDDLHYNDELYYYKWFYGMNDSDFGDYLLTSEINSISKAVKDFFVACSKLTFVDISSELEQLLNRKIGNLSSKSKIYYFLKYKEFFGEKEICVCLIPYSNHFAMRILKNGRSETGSLFNGGHYNPYYLALKNLLIIKKSKIQVTSELIQKNKYIEEWYPLTLSNGISLRLFSEGEWHINLNNLTIPQDLRVKLSDGTTLKTNGDCIEEIVDFICRM